MTLIRDTTPVVDAIGAMNFVGNVIPRPWLQRPELRLENGKLNDVAMMLLSDCVYWYRPTTVVNEDTHQVEKIHKKFQRDKWQLDYERWGEAFGFTYRQVKDAALFLERAGLITRELRTITVVRNGQPASLGNIVFVEPVPAKVALLDAPDTPEALTLKRRTPPSDVQTSKGSDVQTSKPSDVQTSVHKRIPTQEIPDTKGSLPAERARAARTLAALLRKPKSAPPEALTEKAPEVPKTEKPAAPPVKDEPPAPKKVGPEHQAMVDALVAACYPEGGILKSEWGVITRKAKELREAGYTPEQIAEIAADMDKDPFWDGKITPSALAKQAPKWKSKGVRRQKKASPAAAPPVEQELTPEMAAELAELNALGSERSAERARKMGVNR